MSGTGAWPTGRQVLVVNAGSSSLKMKLFPQGAALLVERIGGATAAKATFTLLEPPRLGDHAAAFAFALGVFSRGLPASPPPPSVTASSTAARASSPPRSSRPRSRSRSTA